MQFSADEEWKTRFKNRLRQLAAAIPDHELLNMTEVYWLECPTIDPEALASVVFEEMTKPDSAWSSLEAD